MEYKALELIAKLNIQKITKARFNESLQLMLDAKSKSDCSHFRNELQGMLNALEPEGVITYSDFLQLSEIFGGIWKAKAKSFYFTESAIRKARNVES